MAKSLCEQKCWNNYVLAMCTSHYCGQNVKSKVKKLVLNGHRELEAIKLIYQFIGYIFRAKSAELMTMFFEHFIQRHVVKVKKKRSKVVN